MTHECILVNLDDSEDGCVPVACIHDMTDSKFLRPESATHYTRTDTIKPYTYVGKDGLPVLARDLEDERDMLRKKVDALEKILCAHDILH